MLVLDQVHTNHHCSRAEAEIATSAPQSPSSNKQSTTEAQVKHQGAGTLPLNPPTNKDSSCYGVDPAQPTRKKHQMQNLQNLPSQTEFILSGLSSK